jgi:ADP-ribosylglycohydrolase
MLHPLEYRAMGVLLGLAAGDRIGGPVRMALRVAESLLDCRGFDPDDIARRYLGWWREGAFDAGPTAARVLSLATSGVPFEQAALRVDTEARGMTAGCNPAHRSAPLAMLAGLEESRLEAAAITEARLTHRHPLAGEVAAVVVGLCRALILGASWPAALDWVLANRDPAIARAAEIRTAKMPSNDGFASEALRAALYFVNRSDSFSTALEDSIQFAGTANYCPVLVGSIGGARWGRAGIDERLYIVDPKNWTGG